ncbi:hypothetical protein BJY04DRAFT_83723 [Aspergillus karnatakaensis]|uniref:uncharacterized protein n=1 Tax=Aspergillus karnatakaensis TaxID=1810916 RepID=UPI003CCE003E
MRGFQSDMMIIATGRRALPRVLSCFTPMRCYCCCKWQLQLHVQTFYESWRVGWHDSLILHIAPMILVLLPLYTLWPAD